MTGLSRQDAHSAKSPVEVIGAWQTLSSVRLIQMRRSCPLKGRDAIWATIPIMWLMGASHALSWQRWSPRRRVMENQPMLDLVFRARFRWKLWPRQITGDTTYGTIENIVAVEDQHMRAYVPLPDFDKRT